MICNEPYSRTDTSDVIGLATNYFRKRELNTYAKERRQQK